MLDLQKLCLALCAAKACLNSARMLKAGPALALGDVLATSARCKARAKCLFFAHLTRAMQRYPKSPEHLIFFKLSDYIFATAFIPGCICLSWPHHLSMCLMSVSVFGLLRSGLHTYTPECPEPADGLRGPIMHPDSTNHSIMAAGTLSSLVAYLSVTSWVGICWHGTLYFPVHFPLSLSDNTFLLISVGSIYWY